MRSVRVNLVIMILVVLAILMVFMAGKNSDPFGFGSVRRFSLLGKLHVCRGLKILVTLHGAICYAEERSRSSTWTPQIVSPQTGEVEHDLW